MTDQEMHYMLYIQAELTYSKAHPDLDEDQLFPHDWYSSRNYFLKNKIIAEALTKGIDVRKTALYQNHFLEGVR